MSSTNLNAGVSRTEVPIPLLFQLFFLYPLAFTLPSCSPCELGHQSYKLNHTVSLILK